MKLDTGSSNSANLHSKYKLIHVKNVYGITNNDNYPQGTVNTQVVLFDSQENTTGVNTNQSLGYSF